VSNQETNQPSGEPEPLSSGAFRNLLEAFKEARVPLATADSQATARHQRARLRTMIESRITDARWRDIMRHACQAAERGAHEYLVLRFPSDACTDSGRAIIEHEPGWQDTLTGDAAQLYRHWRSSAELRDFELSARILEWPQGKPGDVGLFLRWQTGARPYADTTLHPEVMMAAMLLLTASGPLVILSSHASPLDPVLLEKLRVKGIRKFVAFEIPLELAKQRYGNHFTIVANDLHETDDLRVLDFDGQHAYQLLRFAELGQPILHEGEEAVG
jgi:hypothetical protein